MKKQSTKRQPRKQQTSGTGLVRSPFCELGVVHPIHVRQPFYRGEHEAMKAEDIFRRIESDIEELVARALHLSVDRWLKEPDSLASFEIPSGRAWKEKSRRLLLREGLNSKDTRERERAEQRYLQLRKLDDADADLAVVRLALIGQQVTRRLELLTRERLDFLEPIARTFSTWPVSLGLGKADRSGKRKVRGAEDAGRLLRRLNLNADNYWPETENPDGGSVSPFRLAAEDIYHVLQVIRHEPFRWFDQGESYEHFKARWKPGKRVRLASSIPEWKNLPQWGQDLMVLPEKMTTANADDWWRVAKTLLDEQWESNHEAFRPLIAACKSKGQSLAGPRHELYESEVRRTVIDLRLKEPFFSLAASADL